MSKRPLTALLLAVSALPLAACAGYVDGPGYAGGPYVYDGYYDGYYGDVYDGYWGDDGGFYYRHGANERAYTRGDNAHFARQAPQGGNYRQLHATVTPSRGMNMPHFSGGHGGGGNHGGGGGGGHGGGGDHH
jgi:hypothetical protein